MKKILAAIAGLTFCAVFTYLLTTKYGTKEDSLTPTSSEAITQQSLRKRVTVHVQSDSRLTPSILPKASARTKTS